MFEPSHRRVEGVHTDRVFLIRDGRLSVASLHPGVTAAEVIEKTGFAIDVPDDVPVTRDPTAAELAVMRG